MNEIFSSAFLMQSLLGALLSSAGLAVISVFVTLKRVSYMSEAFSHIAFAGIALAFLLGMSLNAVSLVFVVAVSLAIGFIGRRFGVEKSNLTVIFLSVSMAAGIIFISLNRHLSIDIAGYLFGNILLITKHDIFPLALLFIMNLLFILLFFKEMFYISYNEETAGIMRIRVNLVNMLFLMLLAMNIVVSVKIVGAILITAHAVLPGMIALNITKKIKMAMLVSVLASLICSFAGFIVSYLIDLPTGATIVMILFLLFLLSIAVRSAIRRTAS